MLAVLAALGSALVLAIASVLQHRAGDAAEGATLWRVLRRPMWLAGAATGVVGFGLHVLALAGGRLSVVQPLLVSTLLFALPLSRRLEHRAIRLIDVIAGSAVVGGLVLFQVTAQPSAGRPTADLTHLAWCVGLVVAGGAAALVAAARSERHRAAWLGLCAGATFGLLAALLKTTVGAFALGWAAVLGSWPPYAFAVIVVGAIAVNQLAFNAGPLASSLPLITIVDPVVSILVGAAAFGETTAVGPVQIGAQLAALVLMSIGVVVLTRRAEPTEPALAPGGPDTAAPLVAGARDALTAGEAVRPGG